MGRGGWALAFMDEHGKKESYTVRGGGEIRRGRQVLPDQKRTEPGRNGVRSHIYDSHSTVKWRGIIYRRGKTRALAQ